MPSKKNTKRTVVVLLMTSPRISGGRRVVMESTRRTSTWTKGLNERYAEMRR